MRHGKKINHLGRTSAHRNAMLSNMASSLIEHKRINTTVAKAKALRVYVEPILTKSKEDSTHNRRIAFSYLQSKEAVTELFRTVGPKISDRNGGYCRIIKTGFRAGDAADMAMIELVDFNEIYNPNEEEKKTTRRSRRGTAKKAEGVATLPAAAKADKQEGASEDKPAEQPVELDQEEEKVADAEVSTEAPAQETDSDNKEEKTGE